MKRSYGFAEDTDSLTDFSLIPGSSNLQQSEEAEGAVLAAVLVEPSLWPKLADGLRIEDFALERHQLIFRGMRQIAEEGQIIDPLTLQAKLEELGDLERVGGVAYLHCLDVHLPDYSRIDTYIEIVKDRSIRRRLLRLCTYLARRALEPGQSGREVLGEAETAVQSLSAGCSGVALEPLGETADEVIGKLEESPAVPDLRFGIPDLDQQTRGLVRGSLVVVAGRPGVGKTSFGLAIARDLALRQGRSTVLFSLEMSAQELALRVLSAEAAIPFQRLAGGILSHTQWNRLHEALNSVRKIPLFIGDGGSLSLVELGSAVRKLRWQRPVDAVIVDYLQLMHSGDDHSTEAQELGAITRGLKRIAREMEISVILLSQLSREPERRGPGARPKLSDLRGSGSIEQDADVVLFPWSQEPAGFSAETPMDLIIAKQRNGPTGDVPVILDRQLMDFRPRGVNCAKGAQA